MQHCAPHGSETSCVINLLQGYHKAGLSAEGLDVLRLGNNYLMKTIAKAKGSTTKDPEFLLAYQVRNALWRFPGEQCAIVLLHLWFSGGAELPCTMVAVQLIGDIRSAAAEREQPRCLAACLRMPDV